jgi:hypothetical protein
MCKVNSVHYVTGKMSDAWLLSLHSPSHHTIKHCVNANGRRTGAQKELDIQYNVYIITFTVKHVRAATNQAIILARAGYVESAPERSAARELSRQRVLRCRRSAAGEIRDAAAGGCRQAVGKSGSQDVWIFAPVVLSGTGSLSRCWSCRTVAPETRAPVRAQAHARTDAVCGTTSVRRADDLQFSDSRTNRTALRCLGSPAQYRASAAASKKTPVSPEPSAISFADPRLVAAYEELRSQAVQGWRRGPGLTLMMARGFRCWMEACNQLFASQDSCTQVPDRLAPSMPSGFRGEVVIVLASMLLRRASKGIA